MRIRLLPQQDRTSRGTTMNNYRAFHTLLNFTTRRCWDFWESYNKKGCVCSRTLRLLSGQAGLAPGREYTQPFVIAWLPHHNKITTALYAKNRGRGYSRPRFSSFDESTLIISPRSSPLKTRNSPQAVPTNVP